jgi:protein-S-isoprenylcysteine O-methyltransferase Ste14
MSIYFYLVIWWLVFFTIHSLLASSYFKNLINHLSGVLKSYYRIIFNFVSTILLMPILYEYFTLPLEFIFATSLTYQITGILLSIAGVYIVIDGFKNYRTDEFVGIYQIKNHHEFHPSKLSRLGWNGVVRHPLYFGGIILIIGLLLISPTIKLGATGLLAISYLYIGTLWEEKKLISEFGSTYKDYKTEVSMLFPLKWLINKLS